MQDRADSPPRILGLSTPRPNEELYYDLLNELSYDLANELQRLKRQAELTTEHISPISDDRPTVFLADVTDDLYWGRDEVKRYLEQANIRILPETSYPIEPEAFRKIVRDDLAKSDLFVQLLSAFPGKKPPDLPQGYVHCQYELASEAGIPILQWRSPELNIDSVQHPEQMDLLQLPNVLAVSIEEFKAEIVKRVVSKKESSLIADKLPPLVFVIADSSDSTLSDTICQVLKKFGVGYFLPLQSEDPAENREAFKQFVLNCDILMLVYGNCSSEWLIDQVLTIRNFILKRKEPLSLSVIIDGPPKQKSAISDDVNWFPGMHIFECRDGLDEEKLQRFFESLDIPIHPQITETPQIDSVNEEEARERQERQYTTQISAEQQVASPFIDYSKILKQREHEYAKQAVDRFVKQFNESYRKLVYYAALPLVLTPELVNYLRNQFLREENVPWVAEVDLLLSDLCKEVGYELYAMDSGVRAYALSEMRQEVGVEQMQNVARLLINYVQQLSRVNPYIGKHELQAQQWAAMAYLDDKREDAIREIAASFRHSVTRTAETTRSGSVVDRAEMTRLSRLVQTLSPELEQYSDLVRYAQDVTQLLTDPTGLQNEQLYKEREILGETLPRLKELAQGSLEHRVGYMEPEQLEDGRKYFSWLHLTDLHRGMKEQHWLWPNVREIFFDDLKRLHEKCGPWDLVLFTGDLTQAGNPKEFQKIDEILEQLWTYFHELGSSPKLLAVPGNHDLVRPDRKDPSVLLLQQWPDQLDIQEEFWEDTSSPYRQVVTQAFEHYTDWWEKQPFRIKNVNTGVLPGDFSATIEKNGAKLGIVGLNTSFLQLTDDNYEGRLALHTMQFHGACHNDGLEWAKQHHACLLLTHHPPVWLNPDSRQHLNGEIIAYGRFAVHLCGHLHETAAREIFEGGAETRRIWQGRSLFGLEYFGKEDEGERLHGYTAGRIELSGDMGTLLFWPRKGELHEGQRSIVPDYSLALTDNQHTYPRDFELLRPYKGKPISSRIAT